MIEPFADFKWGSASFASIDGPRTLTANISFTRCTLVSASGMIAPAAALLTSTSNLPHRCSTFATVLGASSGFPVSAIKLSMFACRLAVLSREAARRPVMSTFAPSSANRSAEALPIPELPPVTITTLFFKLFLPVLSVRMSFLRLSGRRQGAHRTGLQLCETGTHKQFLSRDLATVVGCEKHHGLRDLIGCTEPAERNIVGKQTAIHEQLRSRNVPTVVGRKKRHGLGDCMVYAIPAEQPLLACFGGSHQVVQWECVDGAWIQYVHANAAIL